MNRFLSENTYSTIFTPQEYQAELISSCLERNTAVVLASRCTKIFLITMVTRELSPETRETAQGGTNKRMLIIGKFGPELVKIAEAIQQNTNLAISTYTSIDQVFTSENCSWRDVFVNSQVVVMISDIFEASMKSGSLVLDDLSLFAVTDFHQLSNVDLKQAVYKIPSNCRVLVISSSILNYCGSPSRLNFMLKYIRNVTSCHVDTSSQYVTILRYDNKVHEKVIVCSNPSSTQQNLNLEIEVRNLVDIAMKFFEDHRFDLTETFGDEFAEFCLNIPNPITEPKQILNDFLFVLDNYGLWCADRAALYFLVDIERMKKKIAYDRHFLLLCVTFTVLTRIRAVIEEAFEEYSELDQILKFSSPKILRFIEVLQQIRPLNFVDPRKRREKALEKNHDQIVNSNTKDPFENSQLLENLVDDATGNCRCKCKLQDLSDARSKIFMADTKTRANISSSASMDTCKEVLAKDIPNGYFDRADNPSQDNGVAGNLSCDVDVKLIEDVSLNESETKCVTKVLDSSVLGLNGCNKIESNSHISFNSQLLYDMGISSSKVNHHNDMDLNSCNDSLDILPIISVNTCTCCCHNNDSGPLLAHSPVEIPPNIVGNLDGNDLDMQKLDSVSNGLDSMNFDSGRELTNIDSIAQLNCTNEHFPSAIQVLSEKCPVSDSKGDQNIYSTKFNSNTNLGGSKSSPEKANSNQLLDCTDLIEDTSEPTLLSTTTESFSQLSPKHALCTKNIESINSDSNSATLHDDDSKELSKFDNSLPFNIINEDSLVARNSLTAESISHLLPFVMKTRRKKEEVREKVKVHKPEDPDSVCGIIFVENKNSAKIIYRLLKELSDIGGEFNWIFPQYTVELCKDSNQEARAAENEHRKQEEVLRRFRHHECNLLVSTSFLEHGIDIPHCNLVLRFDPPSNYSSYLHSRGRARALESFYLHLITKNEEEKTLNDLATYDAFGKVLMGESFDSPIKEVKNELTLAENIDSLVIPYTTTIGYSVSMSTAIALVNKYCAKLPSDTFTRLIPMWTMNERTDSFGELLFQCSITLPINSPLKDIVKGKWMVSEALAKKAAALECCRRLHQIGELSEHLLPVGKESLHLDSHLCEPLPDDHVVEGMPRPGSTKRRQYYNKEIAKCLLGNNPQESINLWVYNIDLVLTCPMPEEQNTRGRKIYPPELSPRSFGLITSNCIPKVNGFPVFTRSGEVKAKVISLGQCVRLSNEQARLIKHFHAFTFTQVLRLEKYPIKFCPENSNSSSYIIPLLKRENGIISIDWEFLELIGNYKDTKLTSPCEERRSEFKFEPNLYLDSVVMPWYRNQDQPQYFYVAEICRHLHPRSDFPDEGFESFEKYYLTKYGLRIYNLDQPLLDVDHTSGRLNLLTPRHINRKGVLLPTTSEETKKAKRESLQQKQILVPELCTVHPFPASLWRKAVCLPTILYRLNGLLLANQLRLRVVEDIGLGSSELASDFDWPDLDFGWTLADALARNIEALTNKRKDSVPHLDGLLHSKYDKLEEPDERESPKRKSDGLTNGSEMEIGTWSNDMAVLPDNLGDNEDDYEIFDPNIELPSNLTMIDNSCEIGDEIEGELGADWGTGLSERKTVKRQSKKVDSTYSTDVVRVGSPSNFESDSWGDMVNVNSYFETSNYDIYDFDDYESDHEEENRDKERIENKRRERENDEEEGVNEEFLSKISNLEISSNDDNDLILNMIKSRKEELRAHSFVAEAEPFVVEKSFRKNQRPPEAKCDNSTQTEEKLFEMSYINPSIHTASSHAASASSDHISSEMSKTLDLIKALSKSTQTEFEYLCDDSSNSYLVNREATINEVKKSCNLNTSLEEEDEILLSFDEQPDLLYHPGPSPSIVLQALTTSNANDGINLERLESIGDSFLKYSITNYLYCIYPKKHEGKLSYLRSKQVSNLNLYRLGKRKGLGNFMITTKFEPHDNWLPPGYFVPKDLEKALIESGVPAGHWNMADFPGLHELDGEEIKRVIHERSEQMKLSNPEELANELTSASNPQDLPIFIPYNLLTQHSIPDKSISDCVEALIGAFLTTCGPKGTLLFMSWLGIKVLPYSIEGPLEERVITYHQLLQPESPLKFCPISNPQSELDLLLLGYEDFEQKIKYNFRDRSYLLQAFTHASYSRNRLTDCYQRLEFLGDAVLDYLITRHLFEDKRRHSPGSLTDLRSALVNNTIFACLAVKYDFHKYFRHFSPGLDIVIRDFVGVQEENGHKINEEYYLIEEEEESESAEDIEVPKALGDVFESVAGAIFLDSGQSLDAVWKVYYRMMKREVEKFSENVPKSPIRELLETEPETSKFGKPERLVDGKVRVSVEIFGKGNFTGVGRNYRIAKSTAAKRALRHLKKLQISNKN